MKRLSIKSLYLNIILLSLLVNLNVFAEEKGLQNKNAKNSEGTVEEVIVEGSKPVTESELGLSTTELSGDELTTKLDATLGDTLANEPGVHNASYGPGVGLPVLRGLSGVRIRLSEDGIGAWDASSISPDHATAIEPVIAENIQIIKGPATVLHGNNAIGGTVEVSNGRIANMLTGKRFRSVIEARKELENHHGRESLVGKVRTELGNFVFHFDGFVRESEDMSIPGLAIEEQDIGELFGIYNSDNTYGIVINTDAESSSGSLALSYVDDNFYVGVSSTHIDNEYGIPPGAHTEPADAPGHSHSHPVGANIAAQARVRIDLEQERHLLKLGGELNGNMIENYSVTLGKVEYKHKEFEISNDTGNASNGTRFHNDVVEFKAELGHHFLKFLNSEHNGKMGIQAVDREFVARSEKLIGGEDFVPATEQVMLGIFFYESFPLTSGSFELGGRFEWQEITQLEPTARLLPNNLQFFYSPIRYKTYTLSSSFTYDMTAEHSFIFNLSSAQRAPDIQELLSLGSHLATRSYDIGLLINAQGEHLPKPEKFYGAEIRWEWSGEIGDINSTVFYTDASNFIYQALRENIFYDISESLFRSNCVRLEECVALFDYIQSDVSLTGYEWQWFLPPTETLGGELQFEFFADYVRGKIKDEGDLPRMPPRRQGVGINWSNEWRSGNSFNSELRYAYVSSQNKPGENETSTDAYNLLNASVSYTIPVHDLDDQTLFVFLKMKNLLDKEIRKSTSFLRNFTPEPGREITLGLRYQY